MKRTKIIKLLVTVLAVVLVFAFATTAFAYSEFTTISASSTTSLVKKHDISRSYPSWSASSSDSYFVRYNNSVRLTVRPYEVNYLTKLSLAKTYSPSVESGGQPYDILFSRVDVRANATEDNALCGVTGTWRF